MLYKLIIIDGNGWMYTDMAYQIITKLREDGDTAELDQSYKYEENTPSLRHIFLGTGYKNVRIPKGSIVTNFDNETLLFSILTPEIIKNCTIWDYSDRNIRLIKERFPEADCHLFKMGYSSLLDYNLKYEEKDKDIDVLFLGNPSERREHILNNLSNLGYKVVVEYRKIGRERAELFRRSKICLSVYSSDNRYCISASRFTPILCNNGFIVTENCSNSPLNDYWSQYTISVDYERLCDTITEYLKKPEERKNLADKFYRDFKKTRCEII